MSCWSIHLSYLTFVKQLTSPTTYFIHCDLIDANKNLFTGKKSDILAKFDIRGKPYEKISYVAPSNFARLVYTRLCKRWIAMVLVTSPIVINVPTRGLLAVELWTRYCSVAGKFEYRRIPKVTASATFEFCRQKGPLLTGSRYFRTVKTFVTRNGLRQREHLGILPQCNVTRWTNSKQNRLP